MPEIPQRRASAPIDPRAPGLSGRRNRLLLVLLVLLGTISGTAAAHKLKVFASAEGERIEGRVYFAGGTPASGAHIQVQTTDGAVLANLDPSSDGRFSYQARSPVDHIILADAGDGHRAQWRIRADELAGAFPDAAPPAAPAPSGTVTLDASTATATAPPTSHPEPSPTLDPHLAAAIEQAVAHQIRPLREELAAAQDRARLHDILGGIGYILGLTGIALWAHGRRDKNRPR